VNSHSDDLDRRQDEQTDFPAKSRVCPDCDSPDTRLSRQRTLLVKVFAMLNMSRYKCKACGRRFFAGN